VGPFALLPRPREEGLRLGPFPQGCRRRGAAGAGALDSEASGRSGARVGDHLTRFTPHNQWAAGGRHRRSGRRRFKDLAIPVGRPTPARGGTRTRPTRSTGPLRRRTTAGEQGVKKAGWYGTSRWGGMGFGQAGTRFFSWCTRRRAGSSPIAKYQQAGSGGQGAGAWGVGGRGRGVRADRPGRGGQGAIWGLTSARSPSPTSPADDGRWADKRHWAYGRDVPL